jgi:hypothetical protein
MPSGDFQFDGLVGGPELLLQLWVLHRSRSEGEVDGLIAEVAFDQLLVEGRLGIVASAAGRLELHAHAFGGRLVRSRSLSGHAGGPDVGRQPVLA